MDKQRRKDAGKRPEAVTWQMVLRLALQLPGAIESTSYGTPAVKIGKKLMLRLRDDREAFVMACSFEDRELLMQEQPDIFYITDHYLNYPWVLVRFATVRPHQLPGLLKQAWRRVASPKLIKEFDAFGGNQ